MIERKHWDGSRIVDSTIGCKGETRQVVTLVYSSFPLLTGFHHLHRDDRYQTWRQWVNIMSLIGVTRTWLSIKHCHEPTLDYQGTSERRMRALRQQRWLGRHTQNADLQALGSLELRLHPLSWANSIVQFQSWLLGHMLGMPIKQKWVKINDSGDQIKSNIRSTFFLSFLMNK